MGANPHVGCLTHRILARCLWASFTENVEPKIVTFCVQAFSKTTWNQKKSFRIWNLYIQNDVHKFSENSNQHSSDRSGLAPKLGA